MISAIVPAAGSSTRMGRPKLMLPFAGTTVAGALVRSLRRAGVERIAMVIAAEDHALRDWALAAGVEVAVNPHPERGMLSSVLAGIEAIGGAAAMAAAGEPLLVTPGDLPAIQPETVRLLLAELESSGAPLVVPAYRGQRGHPLVIAAALIPEIPSLDRAIGLRQLLDRHPATAIAVDDRGVVADVDTPDDYEALAGARGPS